MLGPLRSDRPAALAEGGVVRGPARTFAQGLPAGRAGHPDVADPGAEAHDPEPPEQDLPGERDDDRPPAGRGAHNVVFGARAPDQPHLQEGPLRAALHRDVRGPGLQPQGCLPAVPQRGWRQAGVLQVCAPEHLPARVRDAAHIPGTSHRGPATTQHSPVPRESSTWLQTVYLSTHHLYLNTQYINYTTFVP